MKSFVGLILLFFSVGCFALPDCPKDQTKRYHNCYGTYTFADGEKYVGEFKDDERHGQGTYTFASGNKYVGEYKDGNFHGQGTFTYANGEIKSGIWEKDELVEEKQVIVEEKEKQVLPKKIDKWLKITSADGYTLYQDTEDIKKLNEIVYFVAMIDAFEPLDGVVYSYVERRKTDCALVKENLKNRSGKIPSTIIHRTGYSQPMAKGKIITENIPVWNHYGSTLNEIRNLTPGSIEHNILKEVCHFESIK